MKVGFGRSPFRRGPVAWRIGPLSPLGSPPKPYLWRPNPGASQPMPAFPWRSSRGGRRSPSYRFVSCRSYYGSGNFLLTEMANVNLFDLLGDYDIEDPLQLIDAQHEKILSKKLAALPLPPSQHFVAAEAPDQSNFLQKNGF